jgi:hypothetical protein
MARDGRASFFLSHMNWLLSALPRRTKHRHYNHSEQGFQEGMYVTAVDFLKKLVKEPKGIGKLWAELDSGQKSNLKRILIELGYANALALVAMALSGFDDDDENPNYIIGLIDLIANRVAVEQIGSTVAIPSGILGAFSQEPLMLKSKIQQWAEINQLLDTKESRNKYLRNLVPFMRDIEKLQDPVRARQSYMFFQNEEKGLFSKYAWISNAFDEE